MGSQSGITFTFLPENEEDARSYIAGLIPFLKETASTWFMHLFSEDAKIRHLHLRWDNKTRQAYSAEEAELEALLADDDEMNKSDEPTLSKPMGHVDVNIPDVSEMETSSILYNDNDLVSTFNSGIKSRRSTQPSLSFTLRIILPTKPIPLKKNTTIDVDLTDHDSISKISDTESRLSSREERFATFSMSLNEMKAQAKLEAQQNAKALADIMAMLRNPSTAQPSQCDPPGQNVTADKANPLTLDRR